MKNFLSKGSISLLIIFLHFFNAISLNEIISTSYSAWYYKYFTVAYTILGAFFILVVITKNNHYTIKLHESDVVRHNYLSNIDYIKRRTGFLEDDIILRSVTKYNQQLELKAEADINFKDFKTLYNHFKTLDTEQKRELLYQLPYEYHSKLLKELIKNE